MSDLSSVTNLPIAWEPTQDHLNRSRLLRFMRAQGFEAYVDFLNWSIEEPEAFWEAVVEDLDLRFYKPFDQVMDSSRGLPWTRWFPGGKYNYVHNALDKWAASPPRRVPKAAAEALLAPEEDDLGVRFSADFDDWDLDAGAEVPALIWEGDDGASRTLTFRELAREVGRLALGLREMGLRKGDRVGIFMPMLPETVVATLAVNKLGAVYVPIFSGYGAEAVAQRLQDSGAKWLFTADGFLRRGKVIPMKETADAAVALSPTIEKVIVYPRLELEFKRDPSRDVLWSEVSRPGRAPATVKTNPEDPCLLIYTSGTTGRPKGAVHPHCGFAIKATQDMAHLFDVQQGDVFFWYSDLGWMMGPWAIMGALTLGATCVLFEGTPDFPKPDRVWELVEKHKITHLGIAPTAIRALMAHGDEWPAGRDLTSLRILGSSGEPWNPAPWQWFLDKIGGGRCPIINYSGGTEISGGILGCVSIRPLKPCCFNAVAPGMAADVLDDSGQSVRNAVGELVVNNAWPGMTRGFWKDDQRYLDTYWSRWPDTWVHGDWALVDDDGYWYILGRSDDTIKVAGKRVGPAEVESAACGHPAVREAAAIGVPDELKGDALVVFVVLKAEHSAEEALRTAIRDSVTAVLGKSLQPSKVLFARELPKTRNGKVLRRLIRATYLDQSPGDLSSLESVSALDAIKTAE